jgi:hypothetical protein
MAIDLTIHLDDVPGEMGRLGQVLGEAGVNIDGICVLTTGGSRAEAHVLVEDLAAAFERLAAAGFQVASEQEVAVIPLEDRPGALGEVARKLGDAGVNISLAYLATNTRLVLGADDWARARAALGQPA